ncbi:MAG: hypothetical protein GWO24_17900, partial [Akkermansiaceae bacterium]|nr:hypothetical protein [Akkermansiaceae bacterium]
MASWKRADQIAKDVEKRVGPDQPVPLEPKLSPRTAKFIAEDVPAATLAGMKHPNVQRVMYQVADMIEFDPRLAEKLPDTYTALRRSGMSELDMAYYLRDVASGAAKTLASFAPLGKELRRIFSDPEAQSVLSEISKVEPPKWNSY